MMTLWSGGGGGREGVLIKHQHLKFVLPPWRDLSPFPLSSSPSSLFPSLLLLFLLFIFPLAAACASTAYLNEKMGEERRGWGSRREEEERDQNPIFGIKQHQIYVTCACLVDEKEAGTKYRRNMKAINENISS